MSARATDLTMGFCNHGLKCCPHTTVGMIIYGSVSTQLDGFPAARFGDLTMSDCPHCGGAGGICIGGAPKDLHDGVPAQKLGDPVMEPFGMSTVVTGSPTCKDG